MRLYRIVLPVSNIEKAAFFYASVFGSQGKRVSHGRHYFDLGGTILACYDPIADGDEMGGGWSFHHNQYIYVAVADLEIVHEKLRNLDGQYVDSTIQYMPWGERLFYANDPFGNPICFVDEGTIFTGN